MGEFPAPVKGSVFYEDEFVYACLAFAPIVEGHTIIYWKNNVNDMNKLSMDDYAKLMMFVFRIRGVLLKVYQTDKVYIVYLDEVYNVHLQLFPRKSDGLMGYELLNQPAGNLTDFSKIPLLTKALQ